MQGDTIAGGDMQDDTLAGGDRMKDEAPESAARLYNDLIVKIREDGTFILDLNEPSFEEWKEVPAISDVRKFASFFLKLQDAGVFGNTNNAYSEVCIPGSPMLALLLNRQGQDIVANGRHQAKALLALLLISQSEERMTTAGDPMFQSQTPEGQKRMEGMISLMLRENSKAIAKWFLKNTATVLDNPVVATISEHGLLPGDAAHLTSALVSAWEAISYQAIIIQCNSYEMVIEHYLNRPLPCQSPFRTPAMEQERCMHLMSLMSPEKKEDLKAAAVKAMRANIQALSVTAAARKYPPIAAPTSDTWDQLVLKGIRFAFYERQTILADYQHLIG